MPYRYVFLDLDGTLTNSEPGILNSVEYALHKMGIEPPPRPSLLGFIGPPLVWSFSNIIGMSEEDAHRATAAYRENYAAGGMLECEVYEGIVPLLEELTVRGVICVLATCKPHIYANRILAHFGLDRYISFVSGPELDGTRNEKHEVIAYAMEQLGIADPAEILMVGDRASDVLGARHCGVDCAGVLWGFGSREELQEAGACALCKAPNELLSLLWERWNPTKKAPAGDKKEKTT